jgi:hypothetical protein
LGFNESMVLNALELARTVGNEGRTVVLVGHNRAAETIVRKVVGECPGYESGAGAAGTFAGVCGTNAQRVNNCLARERFPGAAFFYGLIWPRSVLEPADPGWTENVHVNRSQNQRLLLLISAIFLVRALIPQQT